jgi:MoaA/NifB/PqqE/SkfB family radical SAM enzyme
MDPGPNACRSAGPSEGLAALVIQPPLALSRHFIDLPWFDLLASLQAAAELRAAGWRVALLDGLCAADSALLEQGGRAWLGQPAEVFHQRLRGLSADLVLLHAGPWTAYEPGRARLLADIAAVRERVAGLLVVADLVIGGSHYVEADVQGLLSAGADLVLRYQAEPLLARLTAELATGRRPAAAVWENRRPVDVARLAAPAWELIDIEAFFSACARAVGSRWRPGPYPVEPRRSLPLLASRGCPYGCLFCSHGPGLDERDRRRFRPVPLERLAGWIAAWRAELGIERIILLDDVANLDATRFDRLLELLADHGLRVAFPNGLRADRLRPRQVARLARMSPGLKVSLESASPRVQRALLGKDLDPAAVERVAAACGQADQPLEIHALIGIPGETREEIVATLRRCVELSEDRGARIRLQTATPLPGTGLERLCRERGLLVGPPPQDLAAGFQGAGRIADEHFDPAFLELARRIFEHRLAAPAPRKVIVNLTYRCNNHCVFCAVGDRPAEDADPAAVERALARHRAAGFDLLDIDGGEPSLHPDLFRVLRAGRRAGFARLAVISNGRRAAYPAFARELAASGLDEVLVSLHAGNAALQDGLTRVPGSFAQTTAGIGELLAALGDAERLAVNTTLVAANLDGLDELAGLLAELGVRRWNLQLVTPFGRARADQVPAAERLRARLGALLDAPPPGVRLQLVNLPPCALPGHEWAAAADFAKAERNMVFVGAGGENLQAYLAGRRRHSEACAGCPWSLLCPGEYRFAR